MPCQTLCCSLHLAIAVAKMLGPLLHTGTTRPKLPCTPRCRLDLWGLGLQGPISERLGDLLGLTRVCGMAVCEGCFIAASGTAPSLPTPRSRPHLPFWLWAQIELAQNQLAGRVPDLQLPFLQELSLHTNNLAGPLPSLSKLPSLQTANLYNNQLTGERAPALPNDCRANLQEQLRPLHALRVLQARCRLPGPSCQTTPLFGCCPTTCAARCQESRTRSCALWLRATRATQWSTPWAPASMPPAIGRPVSCRLRGPVVASVAGRMQPQLSCASHVVAVHPSTRPGRQQRV